MTASPPPADSGTNHPYGKKKHLSLLLRSNYLPFYQESAATCVRSYGQLALRYVELVRPQIKVRSPAHRHYIVSQGLSTITHVFQLLLLRSRNLDMTIYHCHNASCFYAEFVGQITDEEKMFLKLTTIDAAKYVYKKTIFDLLPVLTAEGEEAAPPEPDADIPAGCRIGVHLLHAILQSFLLWTEVEQQQSLVLLHALLQRLEVSPPTSWKELANALEPRLYQSPARLFPVEWS